MTRDAPPEDEDGDRPDPAIRHRMWLSPGSDLRLRPEERAVLLAWWRDCDDPEERRALSELLGLANCGRADAPRADRKG